MIQSTTVAVRQRASCTQLTAIVLCALPDCFTSFKPRRKGQRFCSRYCQRVYAGRKSGKKRFNTGKGYPRRGGKYVHRLVMAKVVGRDLTQDEIVHHKNEVKGDYRRSNLELLTGRAAHLHLHQFKRRKKGKKKNVDKRHR